MPALPRPNSIPQGTVHDAYDRCLDLEVNILDAQGGEEYLTGPILAARVLGFLLINVPTQEGRVRLANEINSCHNKVKIRELGHLYLHAFLMAFKRGHNHKTPTPSEHPSRQPSFDTWKQLHSGNLNPPPDHRTAKTQALVRDTYRCCITGFYDKSIFEDQVLHQWATAQELAKTTAHACHIIPEATNLNARLNGERRNYTTNFWTIVSRFSNDENLPRDLDGPKIHRLQNILIMESTYHDLFDDLDFWFEETEIENRYMLNSYDKGVLKRMPSRYAVFATNTGYALPDPKYLRLHAAAARVCYLSGAGEYIDSFWRDMDRTRVLSKDGSSSKLLASALEMVSHRAIFV